MNTDTLPTRPLPLETEQKLGLIFQDGSQVIVPHNILRIFGRILRMQTKLLRLSLYYCLCNGFPTSKHQTFEATNTQRKKVGFFRLERDIERKVDGSNSYESWPTLGFAALV